MEFPGMLRETAPESGVSDWLPGWLPGWFPGGNRPG